MTTVAFKFRGLVLATYAYPSITFGATLNDPCWSGRDLALFGSWLVSCGCHAQQPGEAPDPQSVELN